MTCPSKLLPRILYTVVIGIWLASGIFNSRAAVMPSQRIKDTAWQQIHALQREKATRSTVQRKLDSQLAFKLRQNRHEAAMSTLTNLPSSVKFEADGRVLVDIDAKVTEGLLKQIEKSGGKVVSSVPRFNAIRALVPLEQMEALAGSDEVKFIRRAVKAQTCTGSATSEGDVTHGADTARSTFATTGAGIKVGVLSDSVDYLTNSQASGDLPTNVVVLPGQEGSGNGEGTAMLEIVNDLAPDARLYFATAFTSEASFAQNILDLRSNGCDIIVDDVYYFDESPFQDGLIAQAVNSVTADGALYFSSAGNGGNLDNASSATWEGDFVDGGTNFIESGATHNFGSSNYDEVLGLGNTIRAVTLFWADPLGASTNDYDLFVLDPSGTMVFDYSDDYQNGTIDPYEACLTSNNCLIVVVKYAGDPRFLHVQLLANGFGTLSTSTTGCSRGHSATTNAFSVAAVRASTAYPDLFSGGTTNPVEYFSADGPRRVFFNADGTPITPEDFSSTGGVIRQKPDIAAADGVATTVPGFQPFYGTSAAAPHAAAIAALLLSYDHALTTAQVRAALTNSALDIQAPGIDADSGVGIVMPVPALEYVRTIFSPLFTSIALTNSNIELTWSALYGQSYQLQFTPDLIPTNWTDLGSPITATNSTATTLDPAISDPQRFYRLYVVP